MYNFKHKIICSIIMDYDLYQTNLKRFYNNLATTSIKYMYFLASDMKTPKVKDEFKMFSYNKGFIVEGEQSNCWHFYQHTHLRYLVSVMKVVKRKPVTVYNVQITGSGDIETNHGDHLTFAIERQSSGNILIKSHVTEYTDTGSYIFSRSENPCNFTFNPDRIANIAETHCELKNGTYRADNICTVYDTTYQFVVKRLCQAMLGKIGGRRKRGNLRSGGGYNGITFMSDQFVQFLREKLFVPLKQIRDDLLTIEVVFDESNYFHETSNNLIVVMCNFGDSSMYERSVFYIESVTAFIACYADYKIKQGMVNDLSKHDKKVYDEFVSLLPKEFAKVGAH